MPRNSWNRAMEAAFRGAMKLGALGALAVFCNATSAQESDGGAEQPPADIGDEIIVRGSLEALRRQIVQAEQLVFARFNDINGDDAFDIHCRWVVPTGTHIRQRVCVANFWREQDTYASRAAIAQMQVSGSTPGAYGDDPGFYTNQQAIMQRQLRKEFFRLVDTDPALHDAVLRLRDANAALTGEVARRSFTSLSRQVTPGDDGLPFGAERVFNVQIGRKPWSHRLTEPVFTIASVTGEIQGLALECDGGSVQLDYQSDVEWHVPPGWSDCELQVRGTRDTVFALYEFDSPADSGSTNP
jgi:hypothetical protein